MDLFGRKERIRELEEELADREEELTERIDELEERLEKEQERAREAAAAKQEAEKEVNRLQDRVRTLEDRLDTGEDAGTELQERHDLDLPQATELLDNLDRLGYRSSKAISIYNTPDDALTDTERGELIVAGPHLLRHAIVPPLPFDESGSYRSSGFMTDRLRQQLEERYCLLHVTAGGSGAAIIEDGEVQESVVVDADIKSQHTKGGYSQKRFERLREEQMDDHLDAVLEEAGPLLDQGFSALLLAGGTDLTDRAQQRMDQETTPFSSRVSHVDDEDDLARSFRTGFRSRLIRLDDETLEAAKERL